MRNLLDVPNPSAAGDTNKFHLLVYVVGCCHHGGEVLLAKAWWCSMVLSPIQAIM